MVFTIAASPVYAAEDDDSTSELEEYTATEETEITEEISAADYVVDDEVVLEGRRKWNYAGNRGI